MDCDESSWIRGPVIGEGSFGCVFTAKPKSKTSFFPPVMAIKSSEFSASASLQKEKEILDGLHGCPFVLECFGEAITMAKSGDMAYNLLLEYASGGTLGDIIDKSNGCGMPENDVKNFTRCILEGLSHIHDSGYVHCDLKPHNILLVPTQTGKFVAKIADLGLAKRSRQSKKQRFDFSMRGTPLYLAPETVVEHLQEPPSDIWALGCVVLEMLTGRLAWDVKRNCNIEQILCMIGDKHSLPEIPSGISQEGKKFLRRCFVRNPMFRFTAEMLLDNPLVQGFDEEIRFRDLTEYPDGEMCTSNSDVEFAHSSSCSSFIPLQADSFSFSSCGSIGETSNGARSTITAEEIFAIPAFAR